jgi:4-phospho-D-threonate 3-dehydrogenase / 4-phospho-D-erythronate 3-dehydrogenase
MIKIGISLGDPGGIGPEVVFKTLKKINSMNCRVVLYGSEALLRHAFLEPLLEGVYDFVPCYDLKSDFSTSLPDATNGEASYEYLKRATEDALAGKIDALVTAPLCKESLSLAGKEASGHTTILKQLCQSENVSMAFYSQSLSVILVTIHHSLKHSISILTKELLHDTFENAELFLKNQGVHSPRIAVAGLNPHAGECGLFGREEIEIIRPAIESYKNSSCLHGPFPPDVVFRNAHLGNYDLVIAMTHDQGLIPLKLLAFDTAVNVTVGLPFIRTSPDHGTAFDIAYSGNASATSFFEAFKFAYEGVSRVS